MTITVSIGVDAVLIMATGGRSVIVSIMGAVIPFVATGGRCDRHCFHYGGCNSYYGHCGAL